MNLTKMMKTNMNSIFQFQTAKLWLKTTSSNRDKITINRIKININLSKVAAQSFVIGYLAAPPVTNQKSKMCNISLLILDLKLFI